MSVNNSENFISLDTYGLYTIPKDKGKPTNSEFIAMISDKLRMQRKVG